eukprot:6847519-Pyramimonas_sp.AAC.1
MEYVAKEILKQSADTVDKKVGAALLEVFANFARVKGCDQDTADDPFDGMHNALVAHLDHSARMCVEKGWKDHIDKYLNADAHEEAFHQIKLFAAENRNVH